MPLKHFTERHIVKLLSTESRRADTTPFELSRSHVALGRYLAGEVVEHLPVEPCEIQHPQGSKTGWKLEDETGLVLLVFLRAGLYAAEGVREVMPRAPVVHVSPKRGVGLSDAELKELDMIRGRRFLLIDSIINTGMSMEPVLTQLQNGQASWLGVLSLVAPVATAQRLERDYPLVNFCFARVSENQYTGKGATDTGNRLFGTIPQTHEGNNK